MSQLKPLEFILKLAETKKSKLALVFDLDSTLFDVSPRITEIIREFAADDTMKKDFAKECAVLASCTHQPNDWGVETTCEKLGLADSSEKFHRAIAEFWAKRFHSNEYLKYDRPMPGAVEYVNTAAATGAKIIYLTGRDTTRYLRGTIEVLQRDGFPQAPPVITMLKPQKDMDDAPFKKDYLKSLTYKFDDIWFFDNEPANVNLVERELPEVDIVFFDGAHSGKEQPNQNIKYQISDFRV